MDSDTFNVLRENVLNVLKLNPGGVQQKTFEDKIPNLKAEQLVLVITELILSSQIETITNKNSKDPFFKLKDSKILTLEKKLKKNEAVINRYIRDAGSKGISFSLIKRNTKFKESEINKVEKRLVELGLIKLYYFNEQKVYVAIDAVPDSSLSERLYVMGDKKRVDERILELQTRVLSYLKNKYKNAESQNSRISERHRASVVTLETIATVIEQSYDEKISTQQIKLILDSLVNSCQVVQVEQSSVVKQPSSDELLPSNITKFVYRFKPERDQRIENVSSCPCVLCPHKEYCTPGREISPENCQYLDHFLNRF